MPDNKLTIDVQFRSYHLRVSVSTWIDTQAESDASPPSASDASTQSSSATRSLAVDQQLADTTEEILSSRGGTISVGLLLNRLVATVDGNDTDQIEPFVNTYCTITTKGDTQYVTDVTWPTNESDSTDSTDPEPSTSTPSSSPSNTDDTLDRQMADAADEILDTRSNPVAQSVVRHWLVGDIDSVDSDRANEFIDTYCTTGKDGNTTVVTEVHYPSKSTPPVEPPVSKLKERPDEENAPSLQSTSFTNLTTEEKQAGDVIIHLFNNRGVVHRNLAVQWLVSSIESFDREDANNFISEHCLLESSDGSDIVVGAK